MSDIRPKYKGSLLRPMKALSFLFREPATLPMEPREASEIYRGFHLNDWEKCIGCGTCGEICDNFAIRMAKIPGLPSDPARGVKPRRPVIDYGRCCWCALCVDICPTGSLSMSREYIHVSRDLDSYLILPDEAGMHAENFQKGWAKSEHSDLLDLTRRAMGELEPEARSDNFDEVTKGFDAQTALLEASRCIQCGMCHEACPAHMHAPEYIRAIWDGDMERAVEEIYRTNPFPHVCGRICTHRCESACSIGRRGDPVAIRWLKRFAMDQVEPEKVQEIALKNGIARSTGKKVAVIGAGPAGLTAAFDLARLGHKVRVYEARPEPGGMMRYGIPEYRLPYDKLDADIEVIRKAGVEIRCNVRLGENEDLQNLRSRNDAVLISTGLNLGRSTRIPGSDHPQVASAVDLLARITLGENIKAPKRIAVIGGGNVAFDIARSMARLQRQQHGKVNMTVLALEERGAMLADEAEVIESADEGIVLINGRGPRQVRIEDGKMIGLETVNCLSIFDEEGRFHPRYDESDLILHEVDMVIEAIGQMSDTSWLGEELTEALEWQRGRIAVDDDGRTSESWLWAAGDLVRGPDVIHAVAAGHKAASSIHGAIAGKKGASR
jgi:glutamate synthase (NADPH/NADH) small chain